MKRIVWAAVLLAALCLLCACGKAEDAPPEMPADFSFSLTWGAGGISSYDGDTGELVKSDIEPEPEKYRTVLTLNGEQLRAAWDAVAGLDWENYVTNDGNYDPNPGLHSEPSMTLILTVVENGRIHRIRCRGVALAYDSEDPDGQALLSACKTLSEILTSSPEWQSLPDYTVLLM